MSSLHNWYSNLFLLFLLANDEIYFNKFALGTGPLGRYSHSIFVSFVKNKKIMIIYL